MDYSISPEEHELRETRQKVENVIRSYEHALDVGSVEFNLGWQELEEDLTVLPGENNLTVIKDPGSGFEGLDKKLLRGLLEIEFFEKAGFDEALFNWQEVLKFAYVKNRVGELLDEERKIHGDLEEIWPELRKELGKRTDDFSEQFYMNVAILGESIGQKLLEEHSLEEIPGLKLSDMEEAGDQLFE